MNIHSSPKILFSLLMATINFHANSMRIVARFMGVNTLHASRSVLAAPTKLKLHTDSKGPKSLSDWQSHHDIALQGVDRMTVDTIKELQSTLDTIKFGCYCGDRPEDTAKRQRTLKLISNVLKNLASKTKSKNCDPQNELYTGKETKA